MSTETTATGARDASAEPDFYGRRIAESDAFRAFANRARLAADDRRLIARIIQLYDDNVEAVTRSFDSDKVLAMRRQLLADTVAQLHRRLPPSSWDDFVHTGLVAGAAAAVRAVADADRP